jgi:hypothetical protein
LFLLLLLPAHAQDEPVHMRPEFALNFPLAQDGKKVTVKYPVMINPSTVLLPGYELRVLYILSVNTGSATTDLALAHKGNMEQSFSREPAGAEHEIPSALAHEIEGYRRTVWEVPNNFVLAMAQYPTDVMHLIYSIKGSFLDLTDERFSFFDGLFVGSPNGKVTVLGVEKQSKADAAGIKAGDEIVSVGGIPTHDDLKTFAAAYASAKKTATDNEVDTYPMIIRTGGGEKSVDIPMPPKIKGGLMNDFFDQGAPPPSPPVKTEPTPPAAPTP